MIPRMLVCALFISLCTILFPARKPGHHVAAGVCSFHSTCCNNWFCCGYCKACAKAKKIPARNRHIIAGAQSVDFTRYEDPNKVRTLRCMMRCLECLPSCCITCFGCCCFACEDTPPASPPYMVKRVHFATQQHERKVLEREVKEEKEGKKGLETLQEENEQEPSLSTSKSVLHIGAPTSTTPHPTPESKKLEPLMLLPGMPLDDDRAPEKRDVGV